MAKIPSDLKGRWNDDLKLGVVNLSSTKWRPFKSTNNTY